MAKKTYTKTLTLPSGKRMYFRGSTKAEVESKYNKAAADVGAGIAVDDHTTVAELADTWYSAFKVTQLHTRSSETIRGTLDRYILPKIGLVEVRAIRPLDIQAVMLSVSHLSKSIQSKVLQALTNIFRLAVDNGVIPRSPVVSTIRAGGKAPEPKVALTPEQMNDLVRAAAGTRAYLFVLLGLYAGLRKSEILGLMWGDVNFERGTISVSRSIVFTSECRAGEVNEELKTTAARRVVPVPLFVVEALREAKRTSNSVFVLSTASGAHYSEAAFNSMWKTLLSRSVKDPSQKGKPIDARHPHILQLIDFPVTPHLLRHTCATRWFEAELDIKEIQYLLGHSTVEMTLNIYTHYDRASREGKTAEKIRAQAEAIGAGI